MDRYLKQDVTGREDLGEQETRVQETGTGEVDAAANANRVSWSTSFFSLSPCKYSPMVGERGRGGGANVKLEAVSGDSRDH